MKRTANPRSKYHAVDLEWAFNKDEFRIIEKVEEPTMLACYKSGYEAASRGSPITSVPKLRFRLAKQWELGWRASSKNKKRRKPQP